MGNAENEYVKLIEKMREMKKEETKRDATVDEIERAMNDFVKEQEDMKVAEGTGLKLKRPPRTVKETIETLKEADMRYEGAKTYLFGSKEVASKTAKSKSVEDMEDEVDPLRNVPRGMSLQRLYYPPTKSEIILVGLRRRAGVHAQFLYDLLTEMRPDSIFVQLPPDLPIFIKNTKPKDDKKTHILYKDQWYRFLKKAQDSAFLINPRPKFTSDIILNQERLKRLFDDNIIPATVDFELGP